MCDSTKIMVLLISYWGILKTLSYGYKSSLGGDYEQSLGEMWSGKKTYLKIKIKIYNKTFKGNVIIPLNINIWSPLVNASSVLTCVQL